MREISVDTQHQYNDMYKKGRYWGQITISRYMSLISDAVKTLEANFGNQEQEEHCVELHFQEK